MKKLLILAMLFTVPSMINAEIKVIEQIGDTVVNCIGGYIFVHIRGGGVTQLMYYDVNEKAMRPMFCSQYRK
jgi:hypothetical protein